MDALGNLNAGLTPPQIVVYGDIVSNISLEPALQLHKARRLASKVSTIQASHLHQLTFNSGCHHDHGPERSGYDPPSEQPWLQPSIRDRPKERSMRMEHRCFVTHLLADRL
jgi:hypothetical protein